MAARQSQDELGKLADLAVDFNRAAVLLGDNVIADREAEAGPLAGRFCREERLKQPFPMLWRMPVPLSRIRNSTASPSSRVVTLSTGRCPWLPLFRVVA
jgi:hypothetical protein